jgi:hypothetical protein
LQSEQSHHYSSNRDLYTNVIQSQYNINTNINLFKIVQPPSVLPRDQSNTRLASEPTLNSSQSQNLTKPRVGKRRLVEAKPDDLVVNAVVGATVQPPSQQVLGINLRKIHELLLRSSQYHHLEEAGSHSHHPENIKSNVRLHPQLMVKAKKAKNAALSANRKRKVLQEIYNESPSKLYKNVMRNTHSQGKWQALPKAPVSSQNLTEAVQEILIKDQQEFINAMKEAPMKAALKTPGSMGKLGTRGTRAKERLGPRIEEDTLPTVRDAARQLGDFRVNRPVVVLA